jgi:glucose/arabinose dehydrogenase
VDAPAAPENGNALLPQAGIEAVDCDPDNGGLILPPGFCAVVVAKDLGRARHMAIRPNGDLYVAINNGPGTTLGGVVALRDTDGDGRADQQARFGPTGGNGVAWGEGQLYFAPDDRVLRYTFTGNELVPTAGEEVIVSGLAATDDHPRKTVVLDGKGGMFVNIASGSNSSQEVDRTDFSPGGRVAFQCHRNRSDTGERHPFRDRAAKHERARHQSGRRQAVRRAERS